MGVDFRLQSQLVLGALAMLAGLQVALAAPQPPEPASRADVEAALAKAGAPTRADKPLRIVLVADRKDHGEHEHDYPLWQERWALLLGGPSASKAQQTALFETAPAGSNATGGALGVSVERATGWPTEAQFASADAIVAFCYLPWTDERKAQVRRFQQRGGGLVLIHSATWTKPKPDAGVAELTGVGGFTRFRHGRLQVEIVAAEHPVCKDLPPRLSFLDEPYWPPTPTPAAGRVTVLAVSQEEEAGGAGRSAQPMFWTSETGGGRVFGCVPGHYTWTFDDPWFRILLLRGIAWAGRTDPRRFDPLVLNGARVK